MDTHFTRLLLTIQIHLSIDTFYAYITYTPRRFVGLQSGINPMYPFKWARLATAAADQWNANLGGGGRAVPVKGPPKKKPSTPPRNKDEIALALQLGLVFLLILYY